MFFNIMCYLQISQKYLINKHIIHITDIRN